MLGTSGFHGRSLISVSDRVFTTDGILPTCSRKSLSAFAINLTWPSIFRRSTLVVSARCSCPGSEVFETVWRLGHAPTAEKNYAPTRASRGKVRYFPARSTDGRCAGSPKLAKFLTLIDETPEGKAGILRGLLQCIIPGWKPAGSGKRLRDRHPAGQAEPNRTEGRSTSPSRRRIRCPE